MFNEQFLILDFFVEHFLSNALLLWSKQVGRNNINVQTEQEMCASFSLKFIVCFPLRKQPK